MISTSASTVAPPAQSPFAPLRASRTTLLTTFRRNGQPVGTPVGITVENDRAYFVTWSTTGKVKRLAHNPRVTLAPCTRMGKPLGPAIAGKVRWLTDQERAQARRRNRVADALWTLAYKLLFRASPVYYEVIPDDSMSAEVGV